MANRAYNLEEFIRILESWGLTDVMLPFLLLFVVIFAILQKARVFGENQRRFNAVISLIISLLVVIPHVLGIYPANADVIDIINTAIPQVSVIIVAIVMLLLIVGILGGEKNWMGGSLSGWVAILAFLSIIYIFGSAAGWWEGWAWFYNFFGTDAIAIVVMLLVFAIIVWWITKGEPGEQKAGALNQIQESFKNFFKPGNK